MKPRAWVREKIPKVKRRRMIEGFVKHRYWYNQGSNALNTMDDLLPIEKVSIVLATWSGIIYLFKQGIGLEIVLGVIGGAFLLFLRAFGKWAVGWFWHHNDGYDVETEWNTGKVPPQRVKICGFENETLDELAEAVAAKLAQREEEKEPCEES